MNRAALLVVLLVLGFAVGLVLRGRAVWSGIYGTAPGLLTAFAQGWNAFGERSAPEWWPYFTRGLE